MVDAELGRDLLSFGKPILVLGDPAQLPPVKGGGFFTEAEPDVMLTADPSPGGERSDHPPVAKSCARAARSPMANTARAASFAAPRSTTADVLEADQVLVGVNRTRRLYNQRIRELKGMSEPLPAAGDKLVCLRNDRVKGLINGGLMAGRDARRDAQGFRAHDAALRGRPEPRFRSRSRRCASSSRAAKPTCPIRSGANPTSSITATRSPSTRRRGRSGTRSCCSTRAAPSASIARAGSTPG